MPHRELVCKRAVRLIEYTWLLKLGSSLFIARGYAGHTELNISFRVPLHIVGFHRRAVGILVGGIELKYRVLRTRNETHSTSNALVVGDDISHRDLLSTDFDVVTT